MGKQGKSGEPSSEGLSNAEKIELAKMYYAEWEYRNTSLWKDLYRWGLLDLILTFLPYLSGSLVKLEGTPLESLPWSLFPFLGMVMGVIIPFCAVSSQKRVAKAGRAYRSAASDIPDTLEDRSSKADPRSQAPVGFPFPKSVSIAVIVCMSCALLITSTIVFATTIMANPPRSDGFVVEQAG